MQLSVRNNLWILLLPGGGTIGCCNPTGFNAFALLNASSKSPFPPQLPCENFFPLTLNQTGNPDHSVRILTSSFICKS